MHRTNFILILLLLFFWQYFFWCCTFVLEIMMLHSIWAYQWLGYDAFYFIHFFLDFFWQYFVHFFFEGNILFNTKKIHRTNFVLFFLQYFVNFFFLRNILYTYLILKRCIVPISFLSCCLFFWQYFLHLFNTFTNRIP